MKILITRASPTNSTRTCERDSRPNVILIKRLSLAFFVRLARTWREGGGETSAAPSPLCRQPRFIHQVYTCLAHAYQLFFSRYFPHFYRPSPRDVTYTLSLSTKRPFAYVTNDHLWKKTTVVGCGWKNGWMRDDGAADTIYQRSRTEISFLADNAGRGLFSSTYNSRKST